MTFNTFISRADSDGVLCRLEQEVDEELLTLFQPGEGVFAP